MPKRDSQGRFLPKGAADRQQHEQVERAFEPSPAERARQVEEYPAADVYPADDPMYG